VRSKLRLSLTTIANFVYACRSSIVYCRSLLTPEVNWRNQAITLIDPQ
jgi:hypothetical protein